MGLIQLTATVIVVEDSDGSSLMGSRNDGSSGDNSLIGGHGVSGVGDCGGVMKSSSSSDDSCSGVSGSLANVLRKLYSSSACSSDMNASGFKAFSVEIIFNLWNMTNVYVSIYVICAIRLFECDKVIYPADIVDIPA